jgi:hypothetical protein
MKKTALWIAALLALTGSALNAQDVAGDWLGTLKAGPLEIRVALHISKAADGGLQGTMDVIDQGVSAIPVAPITFTDSKLKFNVARLNADYEGSANADRSVITGNFTQGQAVPLEFRRGVAAKVEHKPGKPSDIDGDWKGGIDTPLGTLKVVFHIVNTEDGLMATFDVPDQGAKGVPVTSVARDGSSLKMDLKGLAGGFEGKISADHSSIDGTWTQLGNSLPLVLKR